jgi:preprotein translocase subunit YajC
MKIGDKVLINNLVKGKIIKIKKDYTEIITNRHNTILQLTTNNLITKI